MLEGIDGAKSSESPDTVGLYPSQAPVDCGALHSARLTSSRDALRLKWPDGLHYAILCAISRSRVPGPHRQRPNNPDGWKAESEALRPRPRS